MSNARVLVVDDEKAILEMVTRKLTACGHECATASDATTALDFISRNEFDLMLLDVVMPDRSGVELLIDVKDRYPEVAVVMMTGVLDTSTAVKAMRDGAFDYITKPMDLNELTTRIDRVLERRAVVLRKVRELTALNRLLQTELNQHIGTHDAYGHLQQALTDFGDELKRLAGLARVIETDGVNGSRGTQPDFG